MGYKIEKKLLCKKEVNTKWIKKAQMNQTCGKKLSKLTQTQNQTV